LWDYRDKHKGKSITNHIIYKIQCCTARSGSERNRVPERVKYPERRWSESVAGAGIFFLPGAGFWAGATLRLERCTARGATTPKHKERVKIMFHKNKNTQKNIKITFTYYFTTYIWQLSIKSYFILMAAMIHIPKNTSFENWKDINIYNHKIQYIIYI
jgi:hypothetical protein